MKRIKTTLLIVMWVVAFSLVPTRGLADPHYSIDAVACAVATCGGLGAVTGGLGGFSWNYLLTLTPGSTATDTQPSRFTFFDFTGFTGLFAIPGEWALAGVLPVGTTIAPPPGFFNPVNDPGLPNVQFKYVGGDQIPGSGDSVGCPLCGAVSWVFSLGSVFGGPGVPHFYAGVDINPDGFESQNTSSYIGPVVPEPASLVLLGTGLLGFAGLVRRKIKGKKSGNL